MPASPPYVFPALVVVGHVVTLILAWQWRVRKKQGKKSHRREAHFKRNSCAFQRADQRFVSVQIASVVVRPPRSSLLCLCGAHTFSSLPHTPLSLRLGFLWYGCVAVNPLNAGCNVMTSESEYSGGFGLVRALMCTSQHQLSTLGFFLE
ncbi:hypothetical protein KUCAC02_011538 [Chaenocephalus aceratus]|uniref:Uncharacterized protein n=1 Tax=Chaenocephalus aceratus TaxID=36190 RepID=A0ACB9WW41_CHAAC|nr:hypothetical protein KUCAC02_011538 [Chaenocephalus aceratus]